METKFILPELGENIDSGDVVGVLVSVGDTVRKDQAVLELETEKATLEVPAPVSGVVKAIHVKEGDEAKVGQALLTFETEDGAEPAAEAAETKPEEREPTAEAKRKPAEEARPEPVAPPAPQPPLTPPWQGGEGGGEPPAETPRPTAPPLPHPGGRIAPAAPSVRRFAREIGVDINQVSGSGPGGRISLDDVKAYARRLHIEEVAKRPVGVTVPPLPDFSKWGDVERKSMSNIRRLAAEHLSVAWSTIPHVTHADRADVTELEQLRKRYAPKAEEAGGKLTMTPIILKVVASALKTFPQFNASVDMEKREIIYKKYYHIGVAVDTERGLLVPVIRDADRKNIVALAIELTQLVEKARNRKLKPDEMQGGTFTVTNLGGIGGDHFTPIINYPEVAILGVARNRIEAVFRNEQFQPRLMLPLVLSYDHRVIDGADAARFLRWVVEALEEPFLMSLEG